MVYPAAKFRKALNHKGQYRLTLNLEQALLDFVFNILIGADSSVVQISTRLLKSGRANRMSSLRRPEMVAGRAAQFRRHHPDRVPADFK